MYYKFLNLKKGKIKSEHGKQTWEVGKTYSVKGKVGLCKNGFHCSKEPLQALNYVKGDVFALVKGSGDKGEDNDKTAFRSMTIVKAYKWTQKDSVTLAIYAAEQVIKIYEDKYPNDSRPRDAIKAAKAYLKDTSKKNKSAADAAAYAAARAADEAAYAAAYAAARAADAAYAAARAADAAYAAAHAADAADAAHAADAAAYAADAAADAAAYAAVTDKMNRWIKSHIKNLECL